MFGVVVVVLCSKSAPLLGRLMCGFHPAPIHLLPTLTHTLSCALRHHVDPPRPAFACVMLHVSLSHLELRRRELEKQIAAERAAELDMHQQWKGLMDRLSVVKSSADEKDREYKAAQEALR